MKGQYSEPTTGVCHVLWKGCSPPFISDGILNFTPIVAHWCFLTIKGLKKGVNFLNQPLLTLWEGKHLPKEQNGRPEIFIVSCSESVMLEHRKIVPSWVFYDSSYDLHEEIQNCVLRMLYMSVIAQVNGEYPRKGAKEL